MVKNAIAATSTEVPMSSPHKISRMIEPTPAPMPQIPCFNRVKSLNVRTYSEQYHATNNATAIFANSDGCRRKLPTMIHRCAPLISREKRAQIAESEGERQSRINRAEGEKCEAIAHSEGEKQKRINEAQGRAEEIRLVAEATANGIATIASALRCEGGSDAVNLQLAEKYIAEFGKLAKANNTMIIPSDLSNVAGFLKTAAKVIDDAKK